MTDSRLDRYSSDPKSGGDLAAIVAMIHGHPEKPWTVAELAKQARMAQSAFSERFSEQFGQSPMQYLTGHRMKCACQLLRSTQIENGKVAALVGYEFTSSFNNVFQIWIGKSPSQYREEHQS